jgi:acyl-CoA synthetase (AMP-forming)/AMP-acid ligase II
VVGTPHTKWGEAVTAVVVLRPGKHATEKEIIDFAKEKIGSVKAPKEVQFWGELPRSPVGKVLKNVIRQQFWDGTERAVN